MNIVYCNCVTICLLFSLTSVNSNIIRYRSGDEQSIRNLSIDEFNVSNNTKSWIDVIAGIILKSIVLFSTLDTENDPQFQEQIVNDSSLVVKGVSEFLSLYKRFIYDKLWTRKKLNGDTAATIIPVPEEISSNPKEQIEIIGKKYHGRLCNGEDGCEITAVDADDNLKEEVLVADEKEITECPPETTKVAEGQCVPIIRQRFIMSVPKGCPTGYRKDRMGNCRPVFWSSQRW